MINYLLRFIICIALGSWMISAQAQKNVSLTGQLTYTEELSDIWGYVDGSGREYALVGLYDGVSIVDLQDPANPTELFFVPGAKSIWRDIKTHSSYAYISNESDSGLMIIDLTNLPNSIQSKDTVIANYTTAHNVYIDDGILFITGPNVVNGGMLLVDVATDPWHPAWLGSYDVNYVHDVYARNNKAYAAEISAGLLTVIDFADPSSPQVLGSVDYEDSFTHNSWLNDAGDVCFTTDEISGAYVIAWDVSDPQNINQLDRIRSSVSNEQAAPHNTHVLNDYLVTSYYKDGVNIVDASRPKNLVEVGYYDTNPLENGGLDGAWGAYPFLPSGLILVTDIEEGLFVLQPNYQRACYLEGIITDQETSAPLSNVNVNITGTALGDQSKTIGDYAVGIADAGTYEVIFSKYGYRPDTQIVSLSNGIVTTLDVALVPLPRITLEIEVLDAVTLQPIPNAQVQTVAPDGSAQFDFLSNLQGKVLENRFVINNYQLIIGKWGYITQEHIVSIDSTNFQLSYLLVPGYYDDFALDFGWTVVGDAERGIWEREEPIGTYRADGDIYNPEFDLKHDIGDKAYVTGNAGGLPFGDDVDNGSTTLISPLMDLSGYQNPWTTYRWWFLNWSLKGGGKPANDFLSVSITDGLDTFEVARYDGPFDTLWNNQTQIRFLQYFDNLDRPFQLLFYTQDFESGNQDAVEAAIDGFEVTEGWAVGVEDELATDFKLHTYPVPVKDKLTISYELPDIQSSVPIELVLTTIEGKQLTVIPIRHTNPSSYNADDLTINFPYPAGIYFLSLRVGNQLITTKKIIK